MDELRLTRNEQMAAQERVRTRLPNIPATIAKLQDLGRFEPAYRKIADDAITAILVLRDKVGKALTALQDVEEERG